MTIGFIFWLLMLLWLVFGIWSYRTVAAAGWPFMAGNGFMFALLFLLGWRVFGWPIAG